MSDSRVTNIELQKMVEQLTSALEAQKAKLEAQDEQIKTLVESKKLPAKSNEPYVFTPRPPEGGGWFIETDNKQLFGTFAKTRFAGGMAVVMPDEREADERVRSMSDYNGYHISVIGPDELLDAYKRMSAAKPPKEELFETLRSN